MAGIILAALGTNLRGAEVNIEPVKIWFEYGARVNCAAEEAARIAPAVRDMLNESAKPYVFEVADKRDNANIKITVALEDSQTLRVGYWVGTPGSLGRTRATAGDIKAEGASLPACAKRPARIANALGDYLQTLRGDLHDLLPFAKGVRILDEADMPRVLILARLHKEYVTGRKAVFEIKDPSSASRLPGKGEACTAEEQIIGTVPAKLSDVARLRDSQDSLYIYAVVPWEVGDADILCGVTYVTNPPAQLEPPKRAATNR